MSFSLNIYTDKGLVCLERSGELSVTGMFNEFEQFAGHPDFLKINKVLSSFDNVSFCGPSEDVIHFAKLTKPFFKGRDIKVALLAPQDVIFGLANMFGVWFGEDRVRVFREKDKAFEWLQVDQ